MRRTEAVSLFRSVLLAVLLLALATAAQAQVPAEPLYTVTLTAIVAVDEPEVVAAQIAAASGGTVEHVAEGTVTMRLSPSRVRVVAADPRVQSVAPREGMPQRTAVNAETMTWSTGVAYAYDGAGNIRQIGTDAFVYDTVGRLVQSHTNGVPRRGCRRRAFGRRCGPAVSSLWCRAKECRRGRPRNYEYDAFGNRYGTGSRRGAHGDQRIRRASKWDVTHEPNGAVERS